MISISRPTLYILLVVVCLPYGATTLAQEMATIEPIRSALEDERARRTLTPEQWKDFGMRLTEALESDNRGVQKSALRLVAYHGDKLEMGRRATISAVRFYRDDPDPYVRRLAVVAIARINHPWGIDFLTRSLDYESEEGVEATMQNALNERASKPR